MALNERNYIPLTKAQLRLCNKMGSTYYCQDSYVLRQRSQHTCVTWVLKGPAQLRRVSKYF